MVRHIFELSVAIDNGLFLRMQLNLKLVKQLHLFVGKSTHISHFFSINLLIGFKTCVFSFQSLHP